MISKDLAKFGIRVNIISPGPIYFEDGPWDRVKARMPQAFTAAEQACVIGRLGRPEDIANAVAFLASPVLGSRWGRTCTSTAATCSTCRSELELEKAACGPFSDKGFIDGRVEARLLRPAQQIQSITLRGTCVTRPGPASIHTAPAWR